MSVFVHLLHGRDSGAYPQRGPRRDTGSASPRAGPHVKLPSCSVIPRELHLIHRWGRLDRSSGWEAFAAGAARYCGDVRTFAPDVVLFVDWSARAAAQAVANGECTAWL